MAQEIKQGLCINLGWDGVGYGREVQKGGDICIPQACHSTAERSHPTSEVRGRSREDPVPEGRWPRGVTPCPRSGAEAESTRLRRGRNGREELPRVRGQGGWPRGDTQHPRPGVATRGVTPRLRSGAATRGVTPRPRSGAAAGRRYPTPQA